MQYLRNLLLLGALALIPATAAAEAGAAELAADSPESGVIGELAPEGRAEGRLAGAQEAIGYHTYYVELPPGHERLVIELDAEIDLDLAVKHGSEIENLADPEHGGDWDYRDIGTENPTVLEIEQPQAGRWYIDVLNALVDVQEGAYQLTLSVEGEPAAVPVADTESVRLTQSEVLDPALNNLVALTVLLPEGWQQEGGIVWRLDQLPLSTVQLAVYDPQGAAAATFYPVNYYLWYQAGYEAGIPGLQPGQIVSGGLLVQPPPFEDPQGFLQQAVIPAYFAHAQDLSIEAVEPLPAVAAEAAAAASIPGMEAHGESYRARLHYSLDGQTLEEDVYFTLIFQEQAGYWHWRAADLYSLRAPRGELDGLTPLLQTVAASRTPSPDWFAINMDMHQRHVDQVLAGMQQLGETLSQLYHERQQIMDQYHDAWQQRQATQDRIHDAYSQQLRGVDTYQTPDGGRVELPAHYDNVWMQEGGGVFVLSNDPGEDPNVGATESYVRVQPVG